MRHKIQFSGIAWDQFRQWQRNPRMLHRIDQLLVDIDRDPNGPGIGRPERLRGILSGWSSRRIDQEHRLVYRVVNDVIDVQSCRGHYED